MVFVSLVVFLSASASTTSWPFSTTAVLRPHRQGSTHLSDSHTFSCQRLRVGDTAVTGGCGGQRRRGSSGASAVVADVEKQAVVGGACRGLGWQGGQLAERSVTTDDDVGTVSDYVAAVSHRRPRLTATETAQREGYTIIYLIDRKFYAYVLSIDDIVDDHY